MKKNLIILSKSKIKIEAIYDIFDDHFYNLEFIEVPDNIDRKTQPLFIEGTKTACNQRIDEYLKNNQKEYLDKKESFIISIENGILNMDEMTNEYKDSLWGDFCIIGVLCDYNMRKYFLSPEIIAINKKYSSPYFKFYHDKNTEIDTLGKYISKIEQDVPHNNWMKHIAGIDRIEQIKLGLIKAKTFIDEYQNIII
jgi:hypothetical protein